MLCFFYSYPALLTTWCKHNSTTATTTKRSILIAFWWVNVYFSYIFTAVSNLIHLIHSPLRVSLSRPFLLFLILCKFNSCMKRSSGMGLFFAQWIAIHTYLLSFTCRFSRNYTRYREYTVCLNKICLVQPRAVAATIDLHNAQIYHHQQHHHSFTSPKYSHTNTYKQFNGKSNRKDGEKYAMPPLSQRTTNRSF